MLPQGKLSRCSANFIVGVFWTPSRESNRVEVKKNGRQELLSGTEV